MVKLLCMLFAAFSLSACGGTGAPADPGAAQTGTAETETAESQTTESTESDQEGTAIENHRWRPGTAGYLCRQQFRWVRR